MRVPAAPHCFCSLAFCSRAHAMDRAPSPCRRGWQARLPPAPEALLAGIREEKTRCRAIALVLDILFPSLSQQTAQGDIAAAPTLAARTRRWFFVIRPKGPRVLGLRSQSAVARLQGAECWSRFANLCASARTHTRAHTHIHTHTPSDPRLCAHLSVRRVVWTCALDAWRGVRPRPEPAGLGAGSAGRRVTLSPHTGSPGPRRAHRVRGIAQSLV